MTKSKKLEQAKGFIRTAKEWESSVAGHIGRAADNMSVKDWLDVLLMASLAYLGYKRTKSWEGSLLGPISYRLATAPAGTPPISQIAGVAGLAFLGATFSDAGIPAEEGGGQGFWSNLAEKKCPEGYVLEWDIIRGWYCKRIRQPT